MLQNPGGNYVVKILGRRVFLVVNSTNSSSLKKLAKFWISQQLEEGKKRKKKKKKKPSPNTFGNSSECTKSISTRAQYVTLDNKIKCLSLAVFILATPPIKL
jgi:hypothetical protein